MITSLKIPKTCEGCGKPPRTNGQRPLRLSRVPELKVRIKRRDRFGRDGGFHPRHDKVVDSYAWLCWKCRKIGRG